MIKPKTSDVGRLVLCVDTIGIILKVSDRAVIHVWYAPDSQQWYCPDEYTGFKWLPKSITSKIQLP